MGTSLIDNFDYRARRFLDKRQSVPTLATLRVTSEAEIPDGFRAYCAEDAQWYEFNSANETIYPSGKWRKINLASSIVDDVLDSSVHDLLKSVTRNNMFEKVSDAIIKRGLQHLFVDACIPDPIKSDDPNIVYQFVMLTPTSISLYAVDVTNTTHPDWGNYLTKIDEYLLDKGVSKRGALRIYGNRYADCWIEIDESKYRDTVKSTISSLLGWPISHKCYSQNRFDSEVEILAMRKEIVPQVTALSHSMAEISHLTADVSSETHQLVTTPMSDLVQAYYGSTFSGFRRSIGIVSDTIAAVRIPIVCRSYNGSLQPITAIRISLYQINNGSWGNEIYSEGFNVDPIPVGQIFDSILTFKAPIDLSDYGEIGIGYQTDAFSSMMYSNELTMRDDMTANGSYSINGSFGWSPISAPDPSLSKFYYKLYSRSVRTVELGQEQIDNIKDHVLSGVTAQTIDVSLPDKIYAVVGDTLQIFFRGCIKAVNPYNYDILVSCTKGKQCHRYFEYTPTASDIGTTEFRITVKDNDGTTLGTKRCELVTVSNVPASTGQKKILCFGDSLTSGGQWCQTADMRAPDNAIFCGLKTIGSTNYFGAGGWTWADYIGPGRPAVRFQVNNVSSMSLNATYTNNGVTYTVIEINVTDGTGNILCTSSNTSKAPTGDTLTKASGTGDESVVFTSFSDDSQNPLYDKENGAFTFRPYAEKYSDGNIDIVYTLLSWNGQSPHKTDFTTVLSYMTTFARKLHEEFPNAKLKIMGVQLPSLNGGMGANYGATGTSYADTYGMVVTILNQNKAYQEFCNSDEFKPYCEFINVSSQFDSEYNMPYTMKKVNTRNEQTEMIGTNGVHPSNSGYEQIGDIAYRSIMAELSE